MESELDPSPKYQKPKIMLVDIKDDAEVVLKKAGFNVTSGTFGTPYRVQKKDQYLPVIPNGALRDCHEQEVVIIDLFPNEPLDQPAGEKIISEGENDWWAKCSTGLIDPRSRVMAHYKEAFDRILVNGGVFAVFADSRDSQQLVFGRVSRHYGFQIESDIHFDNWSFLSVLNSDQFSVSDDQGREIIVEESHDELGTFFKRHFSRAKFKCALEMKYYEKNNWISIATNKYGKSIAGILVPEKNRKGIVFVLPQLEYKSEFINELLTSILPTVTPKLFPHIEGARWVERPIYELPQIVDLKSQIEETQTQVREKVQKLKDQIQKERDSNSFLHDLIRETDRKLVQAVLQTLRTLGFKDVVDMDEEVEKNKEAYKDEDIQIRDNSPLLLIEVKGIGGIPSDADVQQVAKHIAPRMKKLQRHDIQGLSIINHQRHLPALERENIKTFREDIITASKKQDVGLLTTWDLFRLVRSFIKNNWTHAQVKDIFYQKGRISLVPSHYHFLGIIDEYWEKADALSFKIEEGILKKGHRVAYELPVEFVEQTVESLQIDGLPVNEASKGAFVGIKTNLKKEEAKKGTRVYLICE